MVTSLPTGLKVAGSILGFAVEFFSSGTLLHIMNRLGFSVFQCPLSMFSPALSSEEAHALCGHMSGEALQLFPCSYVRSRVTSFTTGLV